MKNDDVKFPKANKEKLMERVALLPIVGKIVAPKQNFSCTVCKRATGPTARLILPGVFVCTLRSCELTKVSEVQKLFPTPYGSAIHADMISILAQLYELGPLLLVEKALFVDRADPIAEAWVELIRWQQAFDLYERLNSPEGYRQGKITLLPPRRLDAVLAFRSILPPAKIDPLARVLPLARARKIQAIYDNGVAGYEVPF